MSILTSANLFLLEFMIVDIQLNGKYENGTPPGELCASFQFLDNLPVNVCDGDFGDRDGGNRVRNQQNIRNGKSCLFSLTQNQIQNALELFIVVITVYKKMKSGWQPDRCDIGEALVHLEGCFSDIINNNIENLSVDRPRVQTLKNNYDILDSEKTPIGRIDVYIRLTCLGKSIVTQFQMNLEDKSILFKNKDGTSVCKYKKANEEKRNSFRQGIRYECYKKVCSAGEDMGKTMANFNSSWQPSYNVTNGNNNDHSRNPNCPTIPCCITDRANQQNVDNYQLAYNQINTLTPCIECGNLPNAPCPPPITPCIECGALLPAPCLPVSNSIPPIPTAVTQPIECETTKTAPTAMPQPSNSPGNYKIIETAMGPNRLIIRVHKDGNNKIEKISSAGDCSCTPDDFNNQTNTKKTTQQYKKTLTGNSPFTIKMPGTNRNDGMAINPPTYTKPDGTVMTEISDPARDMYVLRIGKKGKRKDRSDKFDLEFCTPRLLQDQRKNHE